MDGHFALFGVKPDDVIIRIKRVVSGHSRAQDEQLGAGRASVDKVVPIAHTRLETGTHSTSQGGLTLTGHQHHLPLQHIDKLIAEGMPVTQGGLVTGLERLEVYPELGEVELVAKLAPCATTDPGIEGFRIAGPGSLRDRLGRYRTDLLHCITSPAASDCYLA